jgi:opacity protein-like surface antigen
MQQTIKYITVGLALAAASVAAVVWSTAKAHAWSGCGAGVHGSFLVGEADFGAPINISSNGQMASASLNCDWRINNLVLGAEASYGFIFGDLEKIGAERDLALTGRFGVLVSPSAMPYLHLGWTQLDTSAGNMDGVRGGIGLEARISDSPLYLDLRYSYTKYDDDLFPPTIDVSSHMFSVGLKFKFGPAYQPKGVFDDAPTAPAAAKCDKKLANCK